MNLTPSKCILLLIGLLLSTFLFAQKLIVYGTVKDALTGESLIGATVIVKESNQAVIANNYGFYSIAPPSGKCTLVCTYLGYTAFNQSIDLDKNTQINIELSPQVKSLAEVTVQSSKSTINSTTVSKNVIGIKRIKSIPSMTGEPDVLKSLQLLPGVQTAGEGSANLCVRGGSFDQNLIILDEAPVYNPSHALGFFSTFNTDALNNVSFYKGAFPAQYGGRLSSIVDITMREGNYKKYAVNMGIGLLASRVTLEGPIVKDKASFIISGRYSYAGQVVNLGGMFGQEVLHIYALNNFNNQNKINFYDLVKCPTGKWYYHEAGNNHPAWSYFEVGDSSILNGYYKTTKLKGIAGHTYSLTVRWKDKEYHAESYMPPVPKIDSVHFNYTKGEIGKNDFNIPLIYFKEPQNERNNYLFITPGGGRVWTYSILSDEYLKEYVNGLDVCKGVSPDYWMTAYPDENSIKYFSIEMHSLTKEGYDYYKALIQQFRTDGGGYSPSPASPPTNMDNGALGFFRASAVDRVDFKRKYPPQNGLLP